MILEKKKKRNELKIQRRLSVLFFRTEILNLSMQKKYKYI